MCACWYQGLRAFAIAPSICLILEAEEGQVEAVPFGRRSKEIKEKTRSSVS
jgi:hypothetical protein